MSHEHHAPAVTEAHANYVAMDGERVTMQILADTAECIREDLEELVRDRPDLADKIENTLDLLEGIEPDLKVCPAPPTDDEKLWAARRLLIAAVDDAQDLLSREAARQRENAVRKEAYAMPPDLLTDLILAIKPEARGQGWADECKTAESVLERYGWDMSLSCNPAYIAKRYEPLRKLSTLLERHSAHPLTAHVLEVMGYALRWCENTSFSFPSPISGKANGQAPEGVLYPRISIEFYTFESWRDIPKEWRGPLVKKATEGEVAA